MSDKIDSQKLIPVGEAFNIISFGIKAIQQTSKGVKKSMKARIKQQKKINKDQKISAARLLNKQKKDDAVSKLEAPSKGGKALSVAKSIKKNAGGIFNRIISAVTAVMTGWLLDKLPKIFAAIEEAVKVIQPIVEAVTTVFTGIFNALDNIWSAADGFISGFKKGDIPKDVDKVGKQFEQLEDDLKATRSTLDSNVEQTKDAINRFAEERGSKDVEDPNKTPVAEADRHLHASGADRPAGLDTSQHAKALHDADDAAIEADIKAQEKANEEGVLDDRPAQSNAKHADQKPNLDYNDQTKVVMDDLDRISEFRTETIKSSISKISFDGKTFPKGLSGPNETFGGKGGSTYDDRKDKAQGDGTTKSMKVTPSGLGLDMYSRKIILNPDAARGWSKILGEAAKDGIDLTRAVTSSYRSPEKQRELIATEDGVNVITPAPVDQSPHVQGWAVDLATNTPEWKWMKENGPKFGWRWQGNADPVHFDYMKGAPDNRHWMQPGRNDWMQGNLKTGEKIASLQSINKKTTIPIPINKITKPVPSSPSNNTGGELIHPTVSGISLAKALQTINSAYT